MQAVYREPDLQVVAGSMSIPATAFSGQEIDISWTVTNAGGRDTRGEYWLDRIYISQDSSIDLYDKLIREERRTGVLAAGDSYQVNTTVRLPDDIQGDFHLLVYIDSPYGESRYISRALPYPTAPGTNPHPGPGSDHGMEPHGGRSRNSRTRPTTSSTTRWR